MPISYKKEASPRSILAEAVARESGHLRRQHSPPDGPEIRMYNLAEEIRSQNKFIGESFISEGQIHDSP
jgi:hypothetical protein